MREHWSEEAARQDMPKQPDEMPDRKQSQQFKEEPGLACIDRLLREEISLIDRKREYAEHQSGQRNQNDVQHEDDLKGCWGPQELPFSAGRPIRRPQIRSER